MERMLFGDWKWSRSETICPWNHITLISRMVSPLWKWKRRLVWSDIRRGKSFFFLTAYLQRSDLIVFLIPFLYPCGLRSWLAESPYAPISSPNLFHFHVQQFPACFHLHLYPSSVLRLPQHLPWMWREAGVPRNLHLHHWVVWVNALSSLVPDGNSLEVWLTSLQRSPAGVSQSYHPCVLVWHLTLASFPSLTCHFPYFPLFFFFFPLGHYLINHF